MEVFRCNTAFNLVLQKGEGSLCLNDLPTYVELTLSQLMSVKENCKWLTLEIFNELKNSANEEILSLPATAKLQNSDTVDWQTFKSETFCNFVERLIKGIEKTLEQFQFWIKFEIFDPRKLPKSKDQLISYGNEELTQLLTHYGSSITDVFQGNYKYVGPYNDTDQTKTEWSGFKYLTFQKQQANYNIIDTKNSAVKMPTTEKKELVLQLKKECNCFSTKMLWESISNDLVKDIYPNMMYLFSLLNIFPISAACV